MEFLQNCCVQVCIPSSHQGVHDWKDIFCMGHENCKKLLVQRWHHAEGRINMHEVWLTDEIQLCITGEQQCRVVIVGSDLSTVERRVSHQGKRLLETASSPACGLLGNVGSAVPRRLYIELSMVTKETWLDAAPAVRQTSSNICRRGSSSSAARFLHRSSVVRRRVAVIVMSVTADSHVHSARRSLSVSSSSSS